MKNGLFIVFIFFSLSGVYAQDSTAFLSIYDKYWEINDGFYRVMKSGKIGLVNNSGDVIIPCENDQVWNLQENGNIKVLKNGKLGLYNLNGQMIVPAEYDMIWEFSDGKARVLRNGKVGYVNELGNEFIPCDYQQIWSFEEGKAKVLRNGKTGYVNESGHEYIPAEYQKIWDFEEGRAKVLKNGKMGFINEQGVEIIACEYQHIDDFQNGVARAIQSGKILYINELGQPVDAFEEGGDDDIRVLKDESVVYYHDADSIIVDEDSEGQKVIKVFGSNMEITKDGSSTQISFQKETEKEWEKSKKKVGRRFKGHYQGVDLGFNSYVTKSGNLSLPAEYSYLDLNSGKSIEFSINALQQNISFSKKGNVGMYTGLGLTYNNYRYSNATIPVVDEEGNLVPQDIEGTLNKNKLTTAYLTAPLMFELQFSRKHRNGFYVAAGAIGAYRIGSHTKIVTMNEGNKSKDKQRGSFTLKDFRYGAHVRLGYRAINIYGTYYMSPMFDTNKAPELYPISVGLSFYPGKW
ncbi:hypothetical protein E9993_04725 [Labilibacter sediminis]|nr:hypothetical protein E9993_04725 [Labilibacter sediminis]